MNNCPTCGAILYNVNSSSNEQECLSKTCSFSTVPSVSVDLMSFFNEGSAAWSVTGVEEESASSESPVTPKEVKLF